MLKKLIICAAAAAVSLSALAQGTDRQKMGTFVHSSYPQVKIPIGPKTYAILEDGEISRSGSVVFNNVNISSKTITNQLNREGADLIINVSNFHEAFPIEVDRFDPRHKYARWSSTPKEGHHRPHPGFACAFMHKDLSYFVTLSTADGTILYENPVAESVEYNSGWWGTEAAAVDSVQRASASQTMGRLIYRNNAALSQLVGSSYMMDYRSIHCYKAEPKRKQPNTYGEINGCVDKMKKAAELVKINEWDIESFKEKTEGCVETWERELNTKNLTDKTARINAEIACGLYYNIALYYLFIKEFQKAGKYFKEVIMIDKRFGDARYFAEHCDKWQFAKDSYEKMMAEQ
ncbi:MAG: hypothetical protein KBT22_01290 [Bacteroidales bacterium]|nr:hypothetical protein [Candidatus Scybalocola fimicaballi]